jgi:hypothetical protein
MENIGIETNSASSGDIHTLSATAVVGVLFLVLLLALISSRRFLKKGIAVHNLFLKIALKYKNHQSVGFVRTLDLRKMQLVMTNAPTVGEKIDFDLSSLSGFPLAATTATGIVKKVKTITGNSTSYLVTVALQIPAAPSELTQTLTRFLQKLT